MSNDVLSKLSSLENTVQEEKNRLSKGMVVSIIFYGILVLVVLGYTTFVTVEYQKMATPKTVAVLISDFAKQKIPLVSEYLREEAKEQAPVWADNSIEYAHKMIPQVETVVKNQLDGLTDQLIHHVQKEYIPQLAEYFKNNIDKVFKHDDVVSDKEMAKALAAVLVEELDKQMEIMVDHRFLDAVDNLRKEFEKIANKPGAQLSCKEDAEKRVFMYWTFLVQNADAGEGKFVDCLRFLSNIMTLVNYAFIENEESPLEENPISDFTKKIDTENTE